MEYHSSQTLAGKLLKRIVFQITTVMDSYDVTKTVKKKNGKKLLGAHHVFGWKKFCKENHVHETGKEKKNSRRQRQDTKTKFPGLGLLEKPL